MSSILFICLLYACNIMVRYNGRLSWILMAFRDKLFCKMFYINKTSYQQWSSKRESQKWQTSVQNCEISHSVWQIDKWTTPNKSQSDWQTLQMQLMSKQYKRYFYRNRLSCSDARLHATVNIPDHWMFTGRHSIWQILTLVRPKQFQPVMVW